MLTYGDGVADVDLARAARVPPRARQARDRHRRPPARRASAASRFDGDARRRVRARSRRSAKAGSTAASSCSSPRCSTTSTATRRIWEREPLERLAAGRPAHGLPPRAVLAADGHARDVQLLEELWERGRRRPWKVWDVSGDGFWRDRPRPRHRRRPGCVGSLARRAAARRAARDVVCLVRDWVPQSELVRSGDARAGRASCDGALEDYDAVERALGEHEIDTVFHLGAQTIVGVAHRDRRCRRFEANIRGTWNVLEACRRQPDLVRRVVVASSDKAYGEHEALPYTEDMPLAGRHPYDVSKACADLIAQSYAAPTACRSAITRCGNIYGGGDLNWSRIVPGTIRSLLRGERPVIRSDGTLRARLLLRRGRRRRLPAARRGARTPARAARRGVQLLRRAARSRVLELVRRILRPHGQPTLEPRRAQRGVGRDPAPVPRRAAKARERARLGAARSTSTTGCERTIAWYREFLGADERRRRRRAARSRSSSSSREYHDGRVRPARRSSPGESPVPVSGRVFDADELQPPRRRVARLLAHDRPLRRRSSSASSPRSFGVRHALLVQLRLVGQPARADAR